MNSKFYEKLPHNASRDKDQQQAQQQLLKTAVPIVYILNELSDISVGDTIDESVLNTLISLAAKSLKVLSYQNKKITDERKRDVVNALHPDLIGLKHVDEPESSFLFGPEEGLNAKIAALKKEKIELRRKFMFSKRKKNFNNKETKNKKFPQKTQWKNASNKKENNA